MACFCLFVCVFVCLFLLVTLFAFILFLFNFFFSRILGMGVMGVEALIRKVLGFLGGAGHNLCWPE